MAKEKIRKTCVICGKEYMGGKLSKTCGDDCRREQDRIKEAERRDLKKIQRNRQKGMSELARDNEEARKMGLSYGKYKEKIRCDEERAARLAKKEIKHG